jgi:hypothetical protein
MVLAVVFLVIGWCAHIVWEYFLDWLSEATGAAGNLLWDLFGIVGLVVVCVGIGWAVTQP